MLKIRDGSDNPFEAKLVNVVNEDCGGDDCEPYHDKGGVEVTDRKMTVTWRCHNCERWWKFCASKKH